jgi:hypothetical protein
MPEQTIQVAKLWRKFATTLEVNCSSQVRTWQAHMARNGFVDEEQLIQPQVFPRFASEFLGFEIGDNLAAETSGVEGRPDFTPADSVKRGIGRKQESAFRPVTELVNREQQRD